MAAAVLTSCVNSVPQNSPEVEDLKEELALLRESNKDLQDKYAQQNDEMSRILEDVAAITGKTTILRMDVENGSARLSEADMIEDSIVKIKQRIAALEKSLAAAGAKNKEFQNMIDGLNKVISQQEDVIFDLREMIDSKDYTIKVQRDSIALQGLTIERQMAELEKLVSDQAKSLCEAGEALEQVADDAPEVSWKKNKEKVDNMRQELYKMALSSYRQSFSAGYEPAKEHIANVLAKIQAE